MSGEGPSGSVRSFEDLIAWQKARELTRSVFELTDSPPIATRFGYRDQIQRAVVSVQSNIAEGFDRGSRAEFHHMLSIAKGSCAEVRSLLYVALDAGYIDTPTFNQLNGQTVELSRVIGGLRSTVARQRDADRGKG